MGAGVEDAFGAAELLGAGGVVVTTLGVDVTVGTVDVGAAAVFGVFVAAVATGVDAMADVVGVVDGDGFAAAAVV
jgi:hypothetical protein